jgi:hypothetical protein
MPTVTVLPCHLKTLCLLQVAVHAFRSQNSESFSTATATASGDSNDTVLTLQNTYVITDNNPYLIIMPPPGDTSTVSTAESEATAGVHMNLAPQIQTTAI